jgi:hypothetical protein
VTGHAILERARLFGTQSADYITASGHSGRIVTEASLQAKTGRIHDRTRTLRSTVRFPLHRGHRPYMTRLDRLLRDFVAAQRAVCRNSALYDPANRCYRIIQVVTDLLL